MLDADPVVVWKALKSKESILRIKTRHVSLEIFITNCIADS